MDKCGSWNLPAVTTATTLSITTTQQQINLKIMYTLQEYLEFKYFDSLKEHQRLTDTLIKELSKITSSEITYRQNLIHSKELLSREYYKDILIHFTTEQLLDLLSRHREHFIIRAAQIREAVDKQHSERYEAFKLLSPHFVN